MAYRFTNTDKWNDSWFYELDLRQKAVFLYLCDLCDIAGFYEINFKRMAQDIGMSDADVKGALKGLYSRTIYSADGKYLFIKNFIKHQKNMPLNENNPAHRGVMRLLTNNLQIFNLQTIEDYFSSPFKGASKGLQSPTGKGSSKGKEKGGMGEKTLTQDENPQLKEFRTFQTWILSEAPRVAKMDKPFTQEQYEQLIKDFTVEEIQETLRNMDNWKDLLKKRIYANKTFRTWAKKTK